MCLGKMSDGRNEDQRRAIGKNPMKKEGQCNSQ